MKTLHRFLLTAGIMIPMVLFFSACNKDDSFLTSDEGQTVLDDALMDATDQDIMTFADQYDDMLDNLNLKSGEAILSDTCPVVTHYISGDTVILTVDFGNGCTDRNDNVRSGKIIVKRIGHYRDLGFLKIIELQNFHVNGNLIEGTRIVENMGLNENGHYYFSVTLRNGKITTSDGAVMTREYTRTREWVAGAETRNVWDDEYLITGYATGTNFRGFSYSRTIVEPLHVKMACRFIVSGVIEVKIGDKEPVIIDYGDGECDNKVTISKGSESQVKEMRMQRFRWRR